MLPTVRRWHLRPSFGRNWPIHLAPFFDTTPCSSSESTSLVTLTVALGLTGCQSSDEEATPPPPPPTVEFSYSGSTQNFTPIDFTSKATDAATYAWQFGDGSTATLPNPSHTFRKAGTYTVTLNTTGPKGAATCSRTLTLVQADTAVLLAERYRGTYFFSKIYYRIVYSDGQQVITPLPSATLTAVRSGSELQLAGSGYILRARSFEQSAGTIHGPGHLYYSPSRRSNHLRIQYPGDSIQITNNISLGNGPTAPYQEQVYIGGRQR
ncbi:PKD domain-containing protein [Hymenobacter chitinivorans]|uniref:PKD domain-containing protein n=1 Tax=Hymenobacter chitinivorans TaxID=89969 RepID=UPI000C23187F